MGFFSSLKEWNDECNEREKMIEQQQAEERRLKWEKEIRDYIEKSRGEGQYSNLIKFLGTADIDGVMKRYAPKLTAMLGAVYLRQEDASRLHELEGRYAELKEHYDELKKAYDKQSELITEIAKKSALTR